MGRGGPRFFLWYNYPAGLEPPLLDRTSLIPLFANSQLLQYCLHELKGHERGKKLELLTTAFLFLCKADRLRFSLGPLFLWAHAVQEEGTFNDPFCNLQQPANFENKGILILGLSTHPPSGPSPPLAPPRLHPTLGNWKLSTSSCTHRSVSTRILPLGSPPSQQEPQKTTGLVLYL